jgi:choline dehydrogenase-like flavoprotein
MTAQIGVESGAAMRTDMDIDADVVVVGSGAGGAVVARTLAEAGKQVVVLEEGPFVPALEHGKMRPSESMRHLWRGGALTVAFGIGDTPAINITMGRGVGGSSQLTGGVCFRIPDYILHHWRAERGLDLFTDELLERYYNEVERNMHVEEVPSALRSRGTVLFAQGSARLGAAAKPMRRNTRGCNGCGRCNFGCPEGAKLSVDQSYLPHAMRAGARILSDCLVSRVVMRGDRAVGVEGTFLGQPNSRTAKHFRVHAPLVVLAAGAAHTPLLLRRSGVVGVSDQVGKNVTVHPAFRMIARFDEEVRGWDGALQSAYVDAYEDERITLTGLFVPKGVLAATMPGVGREHVERASKLGHLAMFGGLIHDEGGGRVWSNPFGREPVLTYEMARDDRRLIARVIRIMGESFFAAGAKEVFAPVLGAPGLDADAFRKYPFEQVKAPYIECSSQHPLGSCRLGKTREHSVVDPYGKVWDTRGLYIADGSIVPTSLGVNPQISIMTLATHVAQGLRDRQVRA